MFMVKQEILCMLGCEQVCKESVFNLFLCAANTKIINSLCNNRKIKLLLEVEPEF